MIQRASWIPSQLPGIWTSENTQSMPASPRPRNSNASSPLAASNTAKPRNRRYWLICERTRTSSSTTSIFVRYARLFSARWDAGLIAKAKLLPKELRTLVNCCNGIYRLPGFHLCGCRMTPARGTRSRQPSRRDPMRSNSRRFPGQARQRATAPRGVSARTGGFRRARLRYNCLQGCDCRSPGTLLAASHVDDSAPRFIRIRAAAQDGPEPKRRRSTDAGGTQVGDRFRPIQSGPSGQAQLRPNKGPACGSL